MPNAGKRNLTLDANRAIMEASGNKRLEVYGELVCGKLKRLSSRALSNISD